MSGLSGDNAAALRPRGTPSEVLHKLRLVPVEVFTGMCDHEGCMEDHGYGISDAVSAWSDCNRAIGRIYRVDDMPRRDPGDSIEVWVNEADLLWFQRKFGDGS